MHLIEDPKPMLAVNDSVFPSPTSASGRPADPHIPNNNACAVARLIVTPHGSRRSFTTLCGWAKTPAGISDQIKGHKPQGTRHLSHIRRPLFLLRMWHISIEAWILEQAGIEFVPAQGGVRVVAGGTA